MPNKNKLTLLMTLIGMAIAATPILPFRGNNIYKDVRAHEEVATDYNVPHQEGPMFYPAEYSSEITDEPNYSTQNTYTFSSMNYNNAHKYYRGDSVKVAVIDSGLNYTHEDFSIGGNQIIQGHSRTIDNSSGSWLYYQFSSGYQSKIVDTLGHGTNVASVIASQINALGCAGIAPNVELYIYKVTNTSNGYEWTAINSALSYCVSEGIDVINMSFQAYEHAVTYKGSTMGASTGCSSVMTSYINSCYNAGITLVAAAGNYNTSEPSYPASNNHVISVGSLAESSTTAKADYSNTYGIDLVAPGTVYVADKGTNSSYKKTSGTSFSAPIVTAAIALYKQQNPSATPAQIESALYASCDSISGNPSWAGHGRLNIDKFLGVDVSDAPVEIVINNSEVVDEELELEVGDYLDLDWTVNGVGTFDDSVNFYTLSGEDNVVSVDSSGRITATGVGSDYVVIESNADSNVYASIYITVTSSGSPTPTVSSVTVSPSSLSLDLNGTKTGNLTATVNGTNNPSQAVTWSSSNTNVATVNSSGVVTAKAIGNATITATSQADGTKSGTCTVTVSDSTVHVTGVSLNKNSTSLTVGGSETLTATVSPNNATNKNVTWTSSDTSVATVSNGTISAVTTGSATITVTTTDGSYTATCTVTVNAATGPTDSTQYSLITSVDDLDVGASYLIAGGTSGTVKTMSRSENGNNRPTVELTVSNSKLTRGSSALSVTLGGTTGAYTFKTDNYAGTAGYLNATSTTGSNYLQVISSLDNYAYFSISFSNSQAVITCTGKSSRNIIRVNTSGTPIACYSSGQNPVYLWKEVSSKTLSSISLNNYTTSFVEGDTFSYGGTVTAHYSDSTSADVTSGATFTGYDMTLVSNQTVTVSYGGQTQTYGITVSAGTLSTISLSGQTTVYQKNAPFSFDGICTVTFNNGYQKSVTPTSVTSPDMSTGGVKEVTVSYTYNNKTVSTSYNITVNTQRTVIEEGYSVIGTITYTSGSESISVNTLSTSKSGYTIIENGPDTSHKAIRLGSGSNKGTLTITSTTSNIRKVVVNARTYNTDSPVTITIGGTSNSLTTSYADYTKEYTTATNSVAIATTTNGKRAWISTVTVYTYSSQDISQSEDCVGLETFISTYMHMDYVDNLGYCKDNEHHYYSTAKTAFNALNEHQRNLFTTNSAYLIEWTRLSTWASKNGDSLNGSNLLAVGHINPINTLISDNSSSLIITLITISVASIAICGYFILRKKKEE